MIVQSPLVSIITPTHGHELLLRQCSIHVFSQNYPHIEWLILDDSSRPSEFFTALRNPRIRYFHSKSPMTVGAKRNYLIDEAAGEIIFHFDDSNYYSPDYVKTLLSAMAGIEADLINLRGWFLYDLRAQFFGYWNLSQGDVAFALHHGQVDSIRVGDEDAFIRDAQKGSGFTFAYKKHVWRCAPFTDLNQGDDKAFFEAASENKMTIKGMMDSQGLFLRFLHPRSADQCHAQHKLPMFMLKHFFGVVPGALHAARSGEWPYEKSIQELQSSVRFNDFVKRIERP